MPRFPRHASISLLALAIALMLLRSGVADEGADAGKLPPAATTEVDFGRDIEPLFQKYCLKCHGNEKQLAGLRLDLEGDAVRGGDSGAAFLAGNSADSLIIKYVAGLDPDVVMPPEGEKLTSDEIGLLRAWIDQGGRWSEGGTAGTKKSDHWSFQPIRRPEEPRVQRAEWARSAIDRFVLARLEAERVAPSPEADRRTLIRRLSLDLLGLPPTPAEVAAFVEDTRPDAYEQLVDRLLASPHFGERWARHWLDLARYADSDGYEKDSPRPHAWRYRQWLIGAINDDLPFDQFTIQQLAGDLLPEATLEQRIATGFHRNTLTNREGGVDQEEYRVAAVVDRVNTTSSVWLGLTMGCCQCHTHKYDPLTLREYYGMFAFFNQGNEVDLPAPLEEDVAAYKLAKEKYDVAHTPLVAAVAEFEQNQLAARLETWEMTLDRSQLVAWQVLVPQQIASTGEAKFARQDDGSFLVSGSKPDTDTYTLTASCDLSGITAFRVESLPDASLGGKGPGRTGHGNFVLSELRVTAQTGAAEPVAVKLQGGLSDFAQDQFPVAAAIDGNPQTGWAVAPQLGKAHTALFETLEPVGGEGTTLTITLEQQHGSQHTLGRFRLAATTAPRPVKLDAMPDHVVAILARSAEERSAEDRDALTQYYKTVDPEFIKLKQAELEHAKQAPQPPSTMAQTLADLKDPRKSHIHIRGDFLRKGDEVSPHTPAVLPALSAPSGRAPTRLDLAKWLVTAENPLTARVTINRVWKHLFGQPLVTSMEDFGTRGEKPSHPELFDWLASEFISPVAGKDPAGGTARPWSIKRMIRLIVTSATYRQASLPRAELNDRDPKNGLLARQNRFRMEAEVIRDLYLAASGLLNPQVGGPSVRPRQPSGISELTYAGSAKWVESSGADRYRRGLYTWFQRTSPYPMLMTFDAPESNVTCARRERSNTPLQALTLLNDPVFHECAQQLGRRMLQDRPADVRGMVQYAFELCTARSPSADELTGLQQLFNELHDLAASDLKAAGELAGEPKPGDAELANTAAAVALARVLLNLDEFVTRE